MSQSKPGSMVSSARSQSFDGGPTSTITCLIFPMRLLRTNSQALRNSFEERCMDPVWNTRLFLRAALTMARAS